MCVDLPLDRKTVENEEWATGPLRASGPPGRRAVAGRGPRAAGPSGRRAAGPWAAGLLLAKPQEADGALILPPSFHQCSVLRVFKAT